MGKGRARLPSLADVDQLLAERLEIQLDYFRTRAKEVDVEEYGAGVAEIYVALLTRLKRYGEAIRATIELIPPGARTSGFAPNLLELSRLSGDYEPLMNVCRQRGDLVSFTAGLMERQKGERQQAE